MGDAGTRGAARAGALAIAVAMVFFPTGASAGGPTQPHALRWSPPVDIAVTAGGAAAWLVSELLKDDLAPLRCRWCEADSVNLAARRALVWSDPTSAEKLSDVTAFLLGPLAAVALTTLAADHDGNVGGAPEDALLVAEAGVIAADVDQLTKMLSGRERPFVHALPPDEKLRTAHPSDNNLSFFSGHTTEAFAIAAASGAVGSLRGYRWAPLAWGVGGALAFTTAYLRIAADRHWLTDVLVGIAIGTGVGVGVPVLFHSRVEPESAPLSTAPSVTRPPAGTSITLAW